MSRFIAGPNVRFSYASVFAPNASSRDKNPKYQTDCIVHKQDAQTLNAIMQAYNECLASVANDARFKNITAQHPSFKHCLKDGDVFKPNDHNYAGHYFFTAKSTQRPEVVGPAMEPLSAESQFYSGCYGNVSIEFKLYAPSANAPESGYGIRCILGNIQKVKDGERLSGGAPAANEFRQVGPPTGGAPIAGFGAQPPAQAQGFPQYPGGSNLYPPAAPAPQANPFGAPQQPPQQAQQWGQPAQQGAFPAAPNPFAPQQQPAPQANPFGAPQANPFGAPQQPAQGFPEQPQAPVNPAAPTAPWGGQQPAQQAPAVNPWEQPRPQFPQ